MQTPIGFLILDANDKGVVSRARFDNTPIACNPAQKNIVHAIAQQELDSYFAGILKQFKTPLALIGTPFQLKVWAAVQEIPYGQTRSYAEIACAIGRPKAVRAVANAISANPIWIMVPCHRVIRSSGGLGGYAGGIERKKWLLAHERITAKKG